MDTTTVAGFKHLLIDLLFCECLICTGFVATLLCSSGGTLCLALTLGRVLVTEALLPKVVHVVLHGEGDLNHCIAVPHISEHFPFKVGMLHHVTFMVHIAWSPSKLYLALAGQGKDFIEGPSGLLPVLLTVDSVGVQVVLMGPWGVD